MKYIKEGQVGPIDLPIVELTRRNLETLLARLDDPSSARIIIDGDHEIAVRAVENDEHDVDRAPGVTKEEVDAYVTRIIEQAKNAGEVAKAFNRIFGPKEKP